MNKYIKKSLIVSGILGVMVFGCVGCSNKEEKNESSITSEESKNIEEVKTFNVNENGAVEFSFDGVGEEIEINTEK